MDLNQIMVHSEKIGNIVHKDGRHYRVCDNHPEVVGFVVDTSDLDFDRWANSTEIYAQPVSDFIKDHS
jgi:hypothetical protein